MRTSREVSLSVRASPSQLSPSFCVSSRYQIEENFKNFYDFGVLSWFVLHNGEGNGTPLQYFCLENPMEEEPGRLQSMGLLRVGQVWATSLSLFTFMHWRRKWQPTPVFLPGESQGQGSLVGGRLWGRTESDTTEVTKQQFFIKTSSQLL